ncbi:hypothetical protein PPROV_000967800 [Pycnococcus provasolii]|uniref:Uncharacterized protein n=1 Tax=Pycnococcus provasolii TaxID=41880 RepID=A0A830HVG4_9CHLO|nr:hypothetical protein PPROV_000967800 [Pycnococcus provasolii]
MSAVSGGVEAVITADDAVNSALMKLGQLGEHLRPALAQYLETEHLHAHDVLFIGYPQNDPRCVVEATVAQKGRKYRELAQQLIILSVDEALGNPVAGIDGVHAKSVARALMGLHRYLQAPEAPPVIIQHRAA